MWSLGMILHKLLFFRLPFISEEMVELEREIVGYRGLVFVILLAYIRTSDD